MRICFCVALSAALAADAKKTIKTIASFIYHSQPHENEQPKKKAQKFHHLLSSTQTRAGATKKRKLTINSRTQYARVREERPHDRAEQEKEILLERTRNAQNSAKHKSNSSKTRPQPSRSITYFSRPSFSGGNVLVTHIREKEYVINLGSRLSLSASFNIHKH
jgi:hypothetical protein